MEVTDSGIGFAAGDQLKVLGEFSQFKRSELEGGGSIRMNFSHVNCNIYIHIRRLRVEFVVITPNH